jgi:hypothetical protein
LNRFRAQFFPNSLEDGFGDFIPGFFNDVNGIKNIEELPELLDYSSTFIIGCFYKPGKSPSKIICLEGSNDLGVFIVNLT